MLPSQLTESYLFGLKRFYFLVTSFILVRGCYRYFYVFLMASFVFEHRVVRVHIMRIAVVEFWLYTSPAPRPGGFWHLGG